MLLADLGENLGQDGHLFKAAGYVLGLLGKDPDGFPGGAWDCRAGLAQAPPEERHRRLGEPILAYPKMDHGLHMWK